MVSPPNLSKEGWRGVLEDYICPLLEEVPGAHTFFHLQPLWNPVHFPAQEKFGARKPRRACTGCNFNANSEWFDTFDPR